MKYYLKHDISNVTAVRTACYKINCIALEQDWKTSLHKHTVFLSVTAVFDRIVTGAIKLQIEVSLKAIEKL